MPIRNKKNPWTTLSEKKVYENPWIKVEEHKVINPSGGNGIYGKVHFKNTAIGIVALDHEMNTWLVGQHRYPLDVWSWEIPEGGSAIGESPLAAAKRELREEAGLKASSWKKIIRTHLSNSVSDEEGFIFLAEALTIVNREPEATEGDMIVRKLPFHEALGLVMKGKITDSLSIMGILMVAKLKKL